MKTPLSTQLLEANNQIAILKAAAETHAKALESERSSKRYHEGRADAALKEIDELHEMLDLIPNAPGREREPRKDEYSAAKLSAAARLIGFVARRAS